MTTQARVHPTLNVHSQKRKYVVWLWTDKHLVTMGTCSTWRARTFIAPPSAVLHRGCKTQKFYCHSLWFDDRDEMKSPTCIVNGATWFLNLGRHRITFSSLEIIVLKYNIRVFGCKLVNDYGYFLSSWNVGQVEKLERVGSPENLKSR